MVGTISKTNGKREGFFRGLVASQAQTASLMIATTSLRDCGESLGDFVRGRGLHPFWFRGFETNLFTRHWMTKLDSPMMKAHRWVAGR